MKKNTYFGEHLTIDGYGGSREKLNDKHLVTKCLQELPTLLDMKKLAEPEVYFAAGNGHTDLGGWTGVVVIEESHISIHTFAQIGFVSIDVYTCKNGMDTEFIIQYFKRVFSLQDVEVNFLKRGMKYYSYAAEESVC